MKLIGVTMVSNEADVIESFVRHNLQFVDSLVILNHRSVDATERILNELAAERLPIAVLRDQDPAFRQGERMTMMAGRYLKELSADFCFGLDADEFIVAPSRSDLEADLDALGNDAAGLLQIRNFVPTLRDDLRELIPLGRLTWRLRDERANARKVVVPQSFCKDPSNRISLGNHAAIRVTPNGQVAQWRHAKMQRTFLAHYPVRNPDQIAKKVILGWLGTRLWRPERYVRPGQTIPGTHWRDLFDSLVRGEQVNFEFMQLAMAKYAGVPKIEPDDLVREPVVPKFSLQYTDAKAPSALAGVTAWANQLVTDINKADGSSH